MNAQQKEPVYFVRYINIITRSFMEKRIKARLLPFLLKGEQAGYIQILDFQKEEGGAHEVLFCSRQ